MLMEIKITTEDAAQIEQVLQILAGAGAISSSEPLENAVQTVAGAETAVHKAVKATQPHRALAVAQEEHEALKYLREAVVLGGRPNKEEMNSRRDMALRCLQENTFSGGASAVLTRLLQAWGSVEKWSTARCLSAVEVALGLSPLPEVAEPEAPAVDPEVLPAEEAPVTEPEVLPAEEAPVTEPEVLPAEEAPAREVSECEIRAVLNRLAGATDVATVKRLLKEVGGAEDGMLKSVSKAAYGHVMDAAEELLTEKAA